VIVLPTGAVPALLQGTFAEDCARLGEALGLEHSAALQARLDADPALGTQLARVLACSRFVLRELERHPELLDELLSSGDLARSYMPGDYAARIDAAIGTDTGEAALMSGLRTVRRREMLRIVWRDLNRLATLAETTRDLSLLAEAALEAALARLHAELAVKHGEPIGAGSGRAQRLVVIGMGKLGARELNLSSDIDLVFAYPEQGETAGPRTLSNQEFFTRLGQRLIRALDAQTSEGFVFRVDMRLRPYGEGGALALHFDALEQYYQDQGRDWERYAMIKARAVAGDLAAGAALLELLKPFTYRRYIDFGAIEALRQMKALINREVARRGQQDDVKLGAGGIREVEFIAQSFQLIRGGREPRLQERSLLRVLEELQALGFLPDAVVRELREAYVFLRDTEHALQAWDDAQTQALPGDAEGQARLAHALGLPGWADFAGVLAAHRERVSRHFADVVREPLVQATDPANGAAWAALWAMEQDAVTLDGMLAAAGFENPAATRVQLAALRDSARARTVQGAGRERLDRCMPLLLEAASRSARPSIVIARTTPLIDAVLRRSAYLVLLEQNPAAMTQLVTLCAASPWIAAELAKHPVLLDELIDTRTLHALPDRTRLAEELRAHTLRIPWEDLEAQMEALRYFKLAHGLRCAASEVSGALPLMKVSDYLSWLAEAILGHVLALAWHNLVARHGAPQREPGVACDPDFVIVAYGKLGGIELGHGSDLDLVFLHDADPDLATDGERSIDNSLFFTRLGQRIIHVLTTYTALGPLYAIDMRLRPSGEKGPLVSTFRAFSDYQRHEAWTWEHQALVRARPVAGCPRLARRFEELRREILARPRDPDPLRRDVVEMRAKMRAHLLKGEDSGIEGEQFHLKQGDGGIVDIEFLVQYAALAWSGAEPSLSVYTDNIRILEALGASARMNAADAALLTGAYKDYRTAAHRLALQQQGELVPAAEFRDLRREVRRIWRELLGP
jgi:glutamate-ammonia-ligase adenylyltransferase